MDTLHGVVANELNYGFELKDFGPRVIFVRPAILHLIDILLHYNWLSVRRIFEIEISVGIHSLLLQEIYIAKPKI